MKIFANWRQRRDILKAYDEEQAAEAAVQNRDEITRPEARDAGEKPAPKEPENG